MMGLDYATYVAWEVGFPLAIVGAFLLGSTLFMIVLMFLKYRIPSLQGLYHSMYSPLLRFLGLIYEGPSTRHLQNWRSDGGTYEPQKRSLYCAIADGVLAFPCSFVRLLHRETVYIFKLFMPIAS